MLDAIKGYVELATGLTEVTVKRAQEAAQTLVNQGMSMLSTDVVPDVPGKDQAVDAAKTAANSVQELADELLETSKQNRDLLTGLIRTEVDRSAGGMGFVREEELAAVRRHIARLENQIADMRMTVALNTQETASAALDSSAVTAAEAKVEALIADGSVDDSKVEDVVAATSDLADAVATHVDDDASSVSEAVSSAVDQSENVVTDAASTVLADVQAIADEAAPTKRKIPYVKPGTEIIEESS